MKFEKYKVTNRDDQVVEFNLAIPETVEELLKVYDSERILSLGRKEYIVKAIKRASSGRSPRLNLRLADLSIEQTVALKKVGLLT